jgi:ABC-type ATPase with predicted acetyltransferase domain
MKRSEKNEETIYVWKCHKCGTCIELGYNPEHEESIYCFECDYIHGLED